MSFNNYNDLNAVLATVKDLIKFFKGKLTVVIAKHTNPCGVATGDNNLLDTFRRAWDGDKVSAFGSVIATNGIIDIPTAEFIADRFIEVILAKDFSGTSTPIF